MIRHIFIILYIICNILIIFIVFLSYLKKIFFIVFIPKWNWNVKKSKLRKFKTKKIGINSLSYCMFLYKEIKKPYIYILNTSYSPFCLEFLLLQSFFSMFLSVFSFFFILITDEPKRRPLLWIPRSKRDTPRRGATFAIQSTTRKWRLRVEGLNERELRHVYSCERVWRVLEMIYSHCLTLLFEFIL